MEVAGKKSGEDICSNEEEGGTVYCDPCDCDGEKEPAEGFCEDCQEYLCSSCFKMHRRPLLWRHHVLLDKDSMPRTKTKETLNYECIEPCVEHSTKIIEYYCQTHDQLGCPVCITGTHRTCNDVEYIPHIAGKYWESSEIKETIASLNNLQAVAEKCSASADNDRLKVKAYKKKANERILQLRDEFISVCDRLKEDIEDVERSDERKINDSIGKYKEISKKIKTRIDILEKKRAEMKISQVFTESKRSKQEVDELTQDCDVARENAKIRHYDIALNVESLRAGLKLNFHDTQACDFETEFERYTSSEYQNELTENTRHLYASETQSDEGGKNCPDILEDSKVQSKINTKTPVKSSSKAKQNVRELHSKEKQEMNLRCPVGKVSDERSPIKSSRKIKYDREFLLQFRDCAYALQKPKNLPDIRYIILNKVPTPNTKAETTESIKSSPRGDTKSRDCQRKEVQEKAGSKSVARDRNYSDVLEDSKAQSKKTAKIPVKSNNWDKQKDGKLHNKEKQEIDLCYSDIKDVWSPLKSSRKIKYDREFLLQFRDCANALQKPKDLPDVQSIILILSKVLTSNTKAESTESDNSLSSGVSKTSACPSKPVPENVSKQQCHRPPVKQTLMQNGYQPMNLRSSVPQQMPMINSMPMYGNNQMLGCQQPVPVMRPTMMMPQPQIPQTLYCSPPRPLPASPWKTEKQKKHLIRIVDPSSGKDVTTEVLR